MEVLVIMVALLGVVGLILIMKNGNPTDRK